MISLSFFVVVVNVECWNLDDIYEDTLKRTFFSDPDDVTQGEMNAINHTLHILVVQKKHEEGDFFFAHKLDADDVYKLVR